MLGTLCEIVANALLQDLSVAGLDRALERARLQEPLGDSIRRCCVSKRPAVVVSRSRFCGQRRGVLRTGRSGPDASGGDDFELSYECLPEMRSLAHSGRSMDSTSLFMSCTCNSKGGGLDITGTILKVASLA